MHRFPARRPLSLQLDDSVQHLHPGLCTGLILNHPHLEHSLSRVHPGASAVHVDQQLGGAVRVLGVHSAQMADDQHSASWTEG
jgi:hypothetical protein